MLKNAIKCLVTIKHKINPKHRFALATLGESTKWLLDFTDDIELLFTLLNDIKTSGTYGSYDMASLFSHLYLSNSSASHSSIHFFLKKSKVWRWNSWYDVEKRMFSSLSCDIHLRQIKCHSIIFIRARGGVWNGTSILPSLFLLRLYVFALKTHKKYQTSGEGHKRRCFFF